MTADGPFGHHAVERADGRCRHHAVDRKAQPRHPRWNMGSSTAPGAPHTPGGCRTRVVAVCRRSPTDANCRAPERILDDIVFAERAKIVAATPRPGDAGLSPAKPAGPVPTPRPVGRYPPGWRGLSDLRWNWSDTRAQLGGRSSHDTIEPLPSQIDQHQVARQLVEPPARTVC
jgi:hypothetical protein